MTPLPRYRGPALYRMRPLGPNEAVTTPVVLILRLPFWQGKNPRFSCHFGMCQSGSCRFGSCHFGGDFSPPATVNLTVGFFSVFGDFTVMLLNWRGATLAPDYVFYRRGRQRFYRYVVELAGRYASAGLRILPARPLPRHTIMRRRWAPMRRLDFDGKELATWVRRRYSRARAHSIGSTLDYGKKTYNCSLHRCARAYT